MHVVCRVGVCGMAIGLLATTACGSSGGPASSPRDGGTPVLDTGNGGRDARRQSDAADGAADASRGSDGAAHETGDSGVATADAGGEASCAPLQTYGAGGSMFVASSVTAAIVDETGAAVVGQPLYICGLDLCSDPASTTSAGMASLTTSLDETNPAFKVGDAINYVELAIPLTTATTDFTTMGTGKLATGRLSDKAGAALTPGATATSGDVTITLAPGTSVGVNTLVYSTPDSQLFRSVAIPLTNLGPVLASAKVGDAGAPANFALVYGVSPAETALCPAGQVTVALPESLGWSPGTAVELWITTTDTAQMYAPYAGWAWQSDGVVSADGKSVSTLGGHGLLLLETFAIRLK